MQSRPDCLTLPTSPANDGFMACSLDQAWEWELDSARAFDKECADRSRTWPPPIMTPLVAAAAITALRRLFPFASHQFRCFATTPEWYLGTGAVAPACIGLVADPDGSIVWSGHLFHDSLRKVLETPDPVAAVTELDRLLTGWPEN